MTSDQVGGPVQAGAGAPAADAGAPALFTRQWLRRIIAGVGGSGVLALFLSAIGL